MSAPYRTFFGIQKEPYSSEINLKEILVTPEVKGVYERLLYTIRLGAASIITGDVGSGKSTALRWAIDQLHPSEYCVIKITACSGSILEFYKMLLPELGIDMSSSSKARLTLVIRKRVEELIRDKRQKPVIIVDEASLLRLEVFMELHTISQFDSDSKPWLPIILAGQNNLVDKLHYRDSAPFASRVVARSHLDAIGKEAMEAYLLHHLKICGVDKNLFHATAVTAIQQGSGGLLRRANHLARGSLIAAAAEKSKLVTADHVRLASSELI